ncbi:MAG TPA: DNA repair protein RecO [Acidimicrobiia bacterium]
MGLRRDQGIVLRGHPFGEADRIVVLLSPNRGKLRTVAKGVRKTKSRFGGRLEPFTHVDLILYEGRNLETITQATPIDVFAKLRRELDKMAVAGGMVEAVDLVAQEGESSHRLFLLLQRGLQTLDREALNMDLFTSFLLKLAGAVGVSPTLDACVSCGRRHQLGRFSFSAGGAVCGDCRVEGAVRIRPELLEYLRRLAVSDFADLGEVDPTLSADARVLSQRFLEYHVEHPLRGLVVLDA